MMRAADLDAEFLQSARLRHWHALMKLKGRVICSLVRDITNNHSPGEAGKILLRRQRNVPGSGLLADYLRNLPGISIK